MKQLILTALLLLPWSPAFVMDPLEIEYIMTGTVFFQGIPLKNARISYYEYPSADGERKIDVDPSGKYQLKINTWGHCTRGPGYADNFNMEQFEKIVGKMNADTLVFYYSGSVFKTRSASDSIMIDYYKTCAGKMCGYKVKHPINRDLFF